MTTDQKVGKIHEDYSNALFQALARTLTKASGSPWQVEPEPEATPFPDGSETALVNCVLDGSLRGELLLEVRRDQAQMLASAFLGQSVAAPGAELDSAFLKLVNACIKEFCSALEQEYGVFKVQASTASERQPDRVTVFQATATGGENPISISLRLDEALIESLRRHSQLGRAESDSANSRRSAEGGAAPEQVNLNLVMDVELNVTLRFGRRQLTLREVLELTTESVVELDREVEEPVELLLDGVVIARGEAVVVDGNYGLRVTEVLQPVTASVLQ